MARNPNMLGDSPSMFVGLGTRNPTKIDWSRFRGRFAPRTWLGGFAFARACAQVVVYARTSALPAHPAAGLPVQMQF